MATAKTKTWSREKGEREWTRDEVKAELKKETTKSLAAIHNIMTMGRRCVRVTDGHADVLLAVADELLRERGLTVVDDKLLHYRQR